MPAPAHRSRWDTWHGHVREFLCSLVCVRLGVWVVVAECTAGRRGRLRLRSGVRRSARVCCGVASSRLGGRTLVRLVVATHLFRLDVPPRAKRSSKAEWQYYVSHRSVLIWWTAGQLQRTWTSTEKRRARVTTSTTHHRHRESGAFAGSRLNEDN